MRLRDTRRGFLLLWAGLAAAIGWYAWPDAIHPAQPLLAAWLVYGLRSAAIGVLAGLFCAVALWLLGVAVAHEIRRRRNWR